MNKISLLAAFLFLSFISSAQDLMVLRTGETLKVKIIASLPEEVNYQQVEIYGDSILVKDKEEILVLIFENGHTEVINGGQVGKKDKFYKEYPINKIAFDAFSLPAREFSLHYERMYKDKSYAIRVPFGYTFSMGEDNFYNFIQITDYYDYIDDQPYEEIYSSFINGNGFRTGVSFIGYFSKPKKVRGYLAPGFVLAHFVQKYDVYKTKYNPEDGTILSREQFQDKKRTSIVGAEVMIGMTILTPSRISIGFETGGGVGGFISENSNQRSTGIWRFSLLLGYNWTKKKAPADTIKTN